MITFKNKFYKQVLVYAHGKIVLEMALVGGSL